MTKKQIIKELQAIQMSIKERDHNGDLLQANIKIINKIEELINKTIIWQRKNTK